MEQRVIEYVFRDLFAPHRLAYLEGAVGEALERARHQSMDSSEDRETTLQHARHELDNIATAIPSGIITPTTKAMLEDAEYRVAALEWESREAEQVPIPIPSLQSVVERDLRELRYFLETNVDEARRTLALAID